MEFAAFFMTWLALGGIAWWLDLLSDPTVLAAVIAFGGGSITLLVAGRRARLERRLIHRREVFDEVVRAFVAQSASLIGYLRPETKSSGEPPKGLLESSDALMRIQFIAGARTMAALMNATRVYATWERRLASILAEVRVLSEASSDAEFEAKVSGGDVLITNEFRAAQSRLDGAARQAIQEFRKATVDFILAARKELGAGETWRVQRIWKKHAAWQDESFFGPRPSEP